MNETREIARRCGRLTMADLDDRVVDRVKYLFLDYLGVAGRGSTGPTAACVHQALADLAGEDGRATVIGTALKSSPPFAALANGVAAHSVELDDVVNEASLHPAVAVFPAALAATAYAPTDGPRFIAACTAGYEVTIKLGAALNPADHYALGFHPTSTCGVFGAAVAAGMILGLDETALTNALGIAGSQAAGSLEFLVDGSYTKRFNAGWAAHGGLTAALLALRGFTGPATIIEGKLGFLHGHSRSADPAKVLDGWGEPWQVLRTSIKPHSCCRYKQGPIDALMKIKAENKLDPAEVEKIELAVLKAGWALVVDPPDRKRNPQTIVDAQFSMPFGAAMALLHGKAELDEYIEPNLTDPIVRELMARVVCVEDESIEQDFPRKWAAKARVTATDGRVLAAEVEFPKGDPENPLTWNEIMDKFHRLNAPVFPAERREEIIAAVRALETCPDLAQLEKLLVNDR